MNTPERNYNTAQIGWDFTHDGVGANFPAIKITSLSAPPLKLVAGANQGAIEFTSAAITTGVALSLNDLDAITTGKAIDVVATGVTQTDGILVNVESASTALTSTGRLLLVNHTGAAGVSTIVAEVKSAAADETVVLQVKASAALALGKILNVSGAAVTTGSAIAATDLDALTTGKGLHVASAATAITTTGRLLYVNHTGTTGTSATLAEIASAATDETIVAQVTASAALALGKVLVVSGAAVTTGTLLDISDNTAHTSGTALKVYTNSSDTTARVLVDIKQDHASASSAVALQVTQDSAAIAVQLTTTATGNQQAVAITSSATTVTSGVISITGAGVTTGIGIKIVLAALTTGSAIDTTGIAAAKQNFNMNASTGSSAAPQTNAAIGFFKIGIGGVDQWVPYYNAT